MTYQTLNRPAVRAAASVALILSLPLVAMQFTDEVVWTLWDFVIVGVLLAIIGVALERAVRRAGSLAMAIGIAALGVAAGFVGMAGDAPGLALPGIVAYSAARVRSG